MNKIISTDNETKLSLKQRLFCEYYVESFGNGTEAVIKAGYDVGRKNGVPNRNVAKSMASENLTKPDILEYLNSLLERSGLNDEHVATQHLFLISQHYDLGIKARAIDMYYRLKGKYAQSETNNTGYSAELESVVNRIRTMLPQ